MEFNINIGDFHDSRNTGLVKEYATERDNKETTHPNSMLMKPAAKISPAASDIQAMSEKLHNLSLGQYVQHSLNIYFSMLEGYEPCNLYELVLAEVEKPLLEVVMRQTNGNISKAAEILGINRGTLRKKLARYGLTPSS
jgi:Fis family transcriptional regulator